MKNNTKSRLVRVARVLEKLAMSGKDAKALLTKSANELATALDYINNAEVISYHMGNKELHTMSKNASEAVLVLLERIQENLSELN